MAEEKEINIPQRQDKPGNQQKMNPEPQTAPRNYAEGKLKGKVAIITGADSGIGQATAILFAREGADVVCHFLSEKKDAEKTKAEVEKVGQKCMLHQADLSVEKNCEGLIAATLKEYGKLDILINNAGDHWKAKTIEEITTEQMEKTFATNFYSIFWVTKYAMPHLQKGASIVNTTSVTAFRGSDHLLDYAATKGAILAFTRSLSANLVEKGIRVNAVAPGPIWTPLIVSTLSEKEVAEFGSEAPMKRAGQPNEVATSFLFLASEDSSYMTGQTLHPNGGEIVS